MKKKALLFEDADTVCNSHSEFVMAKPFFIQRDNLACTVDVTKKSIQSGLRFENLSPGHAVPANRSRQSYEPAIPKSKIIIIMNLPRASKRITRRHIIYFAARKRRKAQPRQTKSSIQPRKANICNHNPLSLTP
jgi:hypothetical protein